VAAVAPAAAVRAAAAITVACSARVWRSAAATALSLASAGAAPRSPAARRQSSIAASKRRCHSARVLPAESRAAFALITVRSLSVRWRPSTSTRATSPACSEVLATSSTSIATAVAVTTRTATLVRRPSWLAVAKEGTERVGVVP
jgi:hypothetical protein